jgi:ABC-type polysaccharide/polyol phosphate transport system ATPase subunit
MITLRNVTKAFSIPSEKRETARERALKFFSPRTVRQLTAVDNVSLQVAASEWIGILGRNGSGKTTMLRLIAGVYEVDSGDIAVQGSLAPFLDLGAGFQTELSAEDNIFSHGVLLGISPLRLQERLEGILRFSGLQRFRRMPLKNFSAGMRARLGFAIMREAEADTYLLDELFAVGDQWFQLNCSTVLQKWRGLRKTVLLATHSLEVVEKYCTRAILLEQGRLIADGRPQEVIRRYTTLPAAAL